MTDQQFLAISCAIASAIGLPFLFYRTLAVSGKSSVRFRLPHFMMTIALLLGIALPVMGHYDLTVVTAVHAVTYWSHLWGTSASYAGKNVPKSAQDGWKGTRWGGPGLVISALLLSLWLADSLREYLVLPPPIQIKSIAIADVSVGEPVVLDVTYKRTRECPAVVNYYILTGQKNPRVVHSGKIIAGQTNVSLGWNRVGIQLPPFHLPPGDYVYRYRRIDTCRDHDYFYNGEQEPKFKVLPGAKTS